MFRKLFVFTAILVALATTPALAASPSYTLKAFPQVSIVSPGENVVVSYSLANNTNSSATCSLSVTEMNFVIFNGSVSAGASLGGTISTPATGKNVKLTFVANCNGTVLSRAVNVKVR